MFHFKQTDYAVSLLVHMLLRPGGLSQERQAEGLVYSCWLLTQGNMMHICAVESEIMGQ